MRIMQMYNISKQASINRQQLAHNQKLPSVKERALVPAMISAKQAPHLSPVGSLTNLLTDLSSTGFRHRRISNQAVSLDKNKEIPLILANEKA